MVLGDLGGCKLDGVVGPSSQDIKEPVAEKLSFYMNCKQKKI